MPQPLSDAVDPINALYYGDGGTGKTTDMLAMANLGRVFAVNAESGIKKAPLRAMGIDTDNIEVFPGPEDEFTYDGLEKEWFRIREALHEDAEAYAGVVWDPVSEIQKVLVEAEAADAVRKAERAGRDRSPFVKDRDNWSIANDQLRLLVRKFRDLPCHFAMSALTRREVDESDGAVVYQPNVTPSMQNDIYGWMDVVCVTSVALVGEEEEFRGLFRPHGKFRGKDRLRALPKWLVNPTFDRVVEYVEGDLAVETDPVMQEARERRERSQAKAEDAAESQERTPAAA